ncbi:MBL fold metallo-hydrolase [Candidatus Sumerlaeota bacterium]|nr:MBL fold metallo-hydrolase [Candidatus Sumerlaeota bacterium]
MSNKVTILGSGTSFGVPVIGCDCEVCRSSNPKNKRLRSSIFVETAEEKILVDCGTDFRQQALRAGIRRIDRILVTHAHADHVSGIDELRIFLFFVRRSMPVWCNAAAMKELRLRFAYYFEEGAYEGANPEFPPVLELHEFWEPMIIGDVRVTPIPVMHGRLEILGFRFNDLAYVTDCKTMPETSMELLRGVDTLILNALRTKPHAVHMSLDDAVALVKEIGPKRAYFVHMTHDLEHEATNEYLAGIPGAPPMELAYDGLTLQFD